MLRLIFLVVQEYTYSWRFFKFWINSPVFKYVYLMKREMKRRLITISKIFVTTSFFYIWISHYLIIKSTIL